MAPVLTAVSACVWQTDNFYDVAEELCGGKSKCSAAVADELFSRAATMRTYSVCLCSLSFSLSVL